MLSTSARGSSHVVGNTSPRINTDHPIKPSIRKIPAGDASQPFLYMIQTCPHTVLFPIALIFLTSLHIGYRQKTASLHSFGKSDQVPMDKITGSSRTVNPLAPPRKKRTFNPDVQTNKITKARTACDNCSKRKKPASSHISIARG